VPFFSQLSVILFIRVKQTGKLFWPTDYYKLKVAIKRKRGTQSKLAHCFC